MISIFWNIYIAIIYGILYLCFVAYPIVFRDIRGWELGISGLAFLGIGIGTITTSNNPNRVPAQFGPRLAYIEEPARGKTPPRILRITELPAKAEAAYMP